MRVFTRLLLAIAITVGMMLVTFVAFANSSPYQPRLDVNHDGLIDIVDIQMVAGSWQTVAPDPIQPNQVNIIAHRYYPFSYPETIAGELRNDTGGSASLDDLYVAFYDASGKLVDVANTTLGIPTSYLPAGQIVPFAMWSLVEPSSFDYYDIGVNWSSQCYDLEPLAILSQTLSIYYGDYRLQGTVRNDTDVSLSGATVYLGDYDANGLVIDVGSEYCSTMAPAAECVYDIRFEAAGYNSYTLQAYGRDSTPCSDAELEGLESQAE